MLSKANYAILDLLAQGDRLSVGRGGTYRFWKSGQPAHYQQVQSLLKRGYIEEVPRGALSIHTEMRITEAGRSEWCLIHDMIGEAAYFNPIYLDVAGSAVGNAARSEEYDEDERYDNHHFYYP